ncbi:MAG: hypothetical protein HY842_03090 [Bacteroidetes bacterium]|nr:hypothetical protein [Bacteroidota bacterium]
MIEFWLRKSNFLGGIFNTRQPAWFRIMFSRQSSANGYSRFFRSCIPLQNSTFATIENLVPATSVAAASTLGD